MADSLSIAASAIAVASAGGKLAQTVYIFIESVRKREKELKPVCRFSASQIPGGFLGLVKRPREPPFRVWGNNNLRSLGDGSCGAYIGSTGEYRCTHTGPRDSQPMQGVPGKYLGSRGDEVPAGGGRSQAKPRVDRLRRCSHGMDGRHVG